MKKILKIVFLVALIAPMFFTCRQQRNEIVILDMEQQIIDELNLFKKSPREYFDTYIKDQDDWNGAKYNTHKGYAELEAAIEAEYADEQSSWNTGRWTDIEYTLLDGACKCAKKHCSQLLKANKLQRKRLTMPVELSDVEDDVEAGALGLFCEIDNSSEYRGVSEAISSGVNTARDVVIQILLDNNNLRHRDSLIKMVPCTNIGVSFCEKKGFTAAEGPYPTVCDIIFTIGYKNK